MPLTVIRRFDCILADTKNAVLSKYEQVKNLSMEDVLLRTATGGKAFYNTSKYTFDCLLDDPDNIEEKFRDYLNGFSDCVQMQKVTPHVCRHTFCSNIAKPGMSPKTLQYIMGHSDISVTLNTYTHIQFEDAKEE